MIFSERAAKIYADLEQLAQDIDMEEVEDSDHAQCDWRDISSELFNGRILEAVDYLQQYDY